MAKFAARFLKDTAGHKGMIISGSSNVLIGGMPAARKGDGFKCSSHSKGKIVEGDSTVLINGKPAARKGDKTSCVSSPNKPEIGKPPQHGHLSLAENMDKKGYIKKGENTPDWADIKARPFYMGYDLIDEKKNGEFDKIKGQITALDYKSKFGNDFASGKLEAQLFNAKGEARAGWGNGYYGATSSAEVQAIGYNVEGQIGKDDARLAYGEAEFKALYATHEATTEAYKGGKEKKYGFKLRTTEEAGWAKAEGKIGTDVLNAGIKNKGKNNKIKTGIEAGVKCGVGWDIGAEAYLDKDNYSLNLGLDVSASFILGVKLGGGLSLSYKPIVDMKNNIVDIKNNIVDYTRGLFGYKKKKDDKKKKEDNKEGIVISGLSSVWIGK
ncbi:hypothetical protein GFU95_02880 [Apibacter sp. B3889]|uniref:PAAR domain-containing protein n=1 Tax=unclassified Apibacter TaxID=2630820 RepID=UPI001324112C|nr:MULTISPECIES: PAAR domain-containing protein [unclassified Apibacter]MXO33960.1 hypothetical protein [Apibacter sp. B3883]MXO41317.1 hypothetical protein [Apibacter sp. B3889]MXP04528.1 hypothetical protein [Apibacter sp. B3887]MXP06703.1 hypothetical protein [Apibacter sp. B3935]